MVSLINEKSTVSYLFISKKKRKKYYYYLRDTIIGEIKKILLIMVESIYSLLKLN